VFRAANLFLVSLLFLTGINCFLSLQVVNQNEIYQDQITIRILKKENSKFGNQYLAWANRGAFYIESKNYYDVGKEYLVQGQIQEFRAENKLKEGQKFDRAAYYLSSGIVGNITKDTIIRSQITCDWTCSTLIQNDKFKKYLVGAYNKQLCGNLKFVSDWFNSDCQKSLAWSLGLTIGVGDYFDAKDKQAVKNLGLTHLIVVSGSQVGLVLAVFEWLALRFGIRKRWRFVFCSLGILFLIIIVGPQAPVLRSSVSVIISMIALIFFGRRLHPIRALMYSAIILLAFNPFFIISYSFWLSFSATFGLIMVTNTLELAETTWLKGFKELFFSTIGTFLYTLPLIVNLAGGVSPIAIVTNIILLPIIPFLTFANLFVFIPVVGEISTFLATISQNLLNIVINDLGANITIWRLSKFGIPELIAYWLVLTLSILAFRHRDRFYKKV
jgi:ComEC/Rec2-related protein